MKETHLLYNGEVELTFVENEGRIKHAYFVKDSVTGFDGRPESSTGILGVIAKPELIPWASKETVKSLGWYEKEIWTPKKYLPVPQEALEAGYKALCEEFERIKALTPEEWWERLKTAKNAHTQKKTEAGDKGTRVHKWIETWIKASANGESTDIPYEEDILPAINAWKQFVNEHNVVFHNSEKKIYSRKYGYAGTMDFDAHIDGVLAVGDIKTSNHFSPDMFFQTSSYQNARQEEFPELKYKKNVIVRCGKDGTLEIQESASFREDFGAFLAAKTLYDRKQETKKIYGE